MFSFFKKKKKPEQSQSSPNLPKQPLKASPPRNFVPTKEGSIIREANDVKKKIKIIKKRIIV
jgi:hypothetical protein